jgi:hypothetical protein
MGHNFLVAAYSVVWIIQLGYLLIIAVKWFGQRGKLSPKSRR